MSNQPHPQRYTSEEILADKDIAFYNIPERVSSGMPIHYIIADEEWGWMNFVEGKYSIHDYIMKNLEWVDPEDPEAELQVAVLTISCADELSRALDAEQLCCSFLVPLHVVENSFDVLCFQSPQRDRFPVRFLPQVCRRGRSLLQS